MDPERLLSWAWRLFAAVGVVVLVVGAVVFVRTAQFVAGAERGTGTVIELSRGTNSEGGVTYYPVVRFTTSEGEAIEFVSSTGSSPPFAVPGDRVDVLYDPDDPYNAKLDGFLDLWLLPGGFVVMGGVLIGIAPLVRHHTRSLSSADAEWLRRHGRRVSGGSPRAILDETIDVNGRSPFRVEVDVHDPVRNDVRVLSSGRVWFDPGPFLMNREALNVYIDPQRPERYLVDLSFLPRAGRHRAEK